MRRSVSLVVSLLALVFTFAGPATADFLDVKGAGPISHLYANNKSDAVVAKIYGDGGKNHVGWVSFKMKGMDGVKYVAKAGWYGENWVVTLYKGATQIECEGFAFTWNGTGDFWKVNVPRNGCLEDLTNRIRVRAEMYSYDNATPGEAGWTLILNRG